MRISAVRSSVGLKRVVVLLGAAALVCSVYAQSHLPKVELKPELRALLAIEKRMAASLEEIPNYTCAQTIHRTQLNETSQKRLEKLTKKYGGRGGRAQALRDFSDTVRLEVAVVDGAEIYSWPGDEFKPVPLGEIIGFGVVTTGSFASLAKSLFVTKQGRIQYVGEEELESGPALRYDYRVALFRSGYQVSTARGTATIGYEGSFWARADDYQLLRLEVRGVEIAPELGLHSLTVAIDYESTAIGEERFLLPSAAVHEMIYWDGALKKNETTFHDCRKFGAASDLSYKVVDEAPEVQAAQIAQGETAALPDIPVGSELHVALVSEINSEDSKVGDRVEARLRYKLAADGRVIAKKGALLLGRLRRIHRVGRSDDPYFAISLEFTRLESDGAGVGLRTKLVRLQSKGNLSRTFKPPPDIRSSRRNIYGINDSVRVEKTVMLEEVDRGMADVDSFYVRGSSFRLGKGFQMTWRVVEAEPSPSAR